MNGANEGICSVGTASVCEGDVVDIEIDSGAEVSCLPSNIGADTYPQHETKLSLCGGHHVAAGGGKLHELGARILGLETDDVRGNMVNLLVRFRVMEIGKALLSTQDLSRPAGCGVAYLIRKVSNTRITFKQQWSNGPRGCRGEHASEEARDAFSTDSRRPRRAHSQRARSVQNLVSRMLHRTRWNAPTPCRRKGNCDTSDCH